MYFSKSEKGTLIFSIIIIIVIFILSANLAWINPDTRGAIKVLNFPLFWQYDADSILELGTATYFPDLLKDLPVRLTRPIYPFIVNTLGHFFSFLSPFEIDFVYFTAFSYFFLKLIVYFLSAICLIKICSHLKLEDETTKIILLILFFNSILIKSITTFHTTELQLLLPIISTYFYILFLKKKINILFFGFLLGVIFLSKTNYAIILAIFLHLIFYKKFKESLLFLIIFYIPTILWTIFYQSYWNIDYTMAKQAKEYGWFSADFFNIGYYLKSFYSCLITFFKSFYILLIIMILYTVKFKLKFINRDHLIFILLFILSTMFQMFVTNKVSSIYMTKDLNFIYSIILGLMIFKIWKSMKYFSFSRINILLFSIILLGNSIISLANFPLIHPYKQGILDDHKKYMETAIEKYE
jgi:hypothetical protein